MNPEELLIIFQRIAAGKQTTADVAALGDVLISTGDQHVVQSGVGNINIGQGRDIQILNYHFSQQQTEIICHFLERLGETTTNPHNLPRSGIRQFVGRDAALEELDNQLQECERVAISTLTGMGGIGKSELALQYALNDRDRQPEQRIYQGGICWVNVSDKGDVGTQILNFAREYLEIPILEEGELSARVRLCWQNWLAGNTLIVFDDVREYAQIKDYLPPQEKRFKVIITTRKQKLAQSIKVFALEVLQEQPALDLIASFIGQERVNSQLESARGLCQDLGYLPLGLELVARFLNRRQNWSISKMRQRLAEKQLATRPLAEASAEMTAERGVRAAFEVSWQELTEEAQTLASYLSLFALAPIPYSFIQAVAPIEDEEELEDIFEDSLINLSLIKNTREQWYEMHTLIQQYLRQKLEESELATNAQQAYCQLMTAFAQEIRQTPVQTEIQNLTPLIPHLAVAARELNQWIADDDLVWVYLGLGRFYEGQGLYQEAEPWYEQCLSITQERLGDDHPHVASSLNNLAELYRSQGQYEAALPLYQQSLDLYRKLLGEEHSDVASSLNNLALLYHSQGRYELALPLFQQSLDMRRKLLGDDHPDVASSLNNLAGLYESQGQYEAALPLYQQSLDMTRKLLGDDHPNVASSLNNLAGLYESQGQYEAALPLYQQSLDLLRKLLGDDHSHVASSLNNLALLYKSQGQYELALPLFQQSLEMFGKLLGEEHPHVASSLNNLALLYHSQGRYELALPLFQQSLDLRRKLLGDDHPDVATSLNNLAGLYDSQGQYEAALPLYQQSLDLKRKLLGDDHPSVALSLNNLALLYKSQGQYELALPLFQQSLEMFGKLLGEEHPSTNTVQKNLQHAMVMKYLNMPEAEMREILPEEVCEQLLEYKRELESESELN